MLRKLQGFSRNSSSDGPSPPSGHSTDFVETIEKVVVGMRQSQPRNCLQTRGTSVQTGLPCRGLVTALLRGSPSIGEAALPGSWRATILRFVAQSPSRRSGRELTELLR
jgi:hypothetical protein